MTKVCLTAGFDRSRTTIAVAELLRREGVEVDAIFVVTPLSVERLRAYVRQRGAGFVVTAAQRLVGRGRDRNHRDAVDELLDDHGIAARSLRAWSRTHGVAYHLVASLNHPASIAALEALAPDMVVYGGGGILKEGFICAAQGRIINAHAGPLPEIRGMNACEWSLLLGVAPAVTIHFIDRGIDTGGIIRAYPLEIAPGDTIASLRARSQALGVRGLVAAVLDPPSAAPPANKPRSRQCFVLAPALLELLEQRLAADRARQ